jgi:hypothetical protein
MSIEQSILENCKDPATWAGLIDSIPDHLLTYDLAFRAVQIDGDLLKSIPKSLIDYKMASEAVKSNNYSLRYISDNLKDHNLVMMAVTNNGNSLEYAGKFRLNRDVCIRAVQNNEYAIQYVDPSLQPDSELLLATIHDSHRWSPSHPILRYTPDSLRENTDFINKVRERNPMYASLLTPVSYKKYFLYGSSIITIAVLSYLAFIN